MQSLKNYMQKKPTPFTPLLPTANENEFLSQSGRGMLHRINTSDTKDFNRLDISRGLQSIKENSTIDETSIISLKARFKLEHYYNHKTEDRVYVKLFGEYYQDFTGTFATLISLIPKSFKSILSDTTLLRNCGFGYHSQIKDKLLIVFYALVEKNSEVVELITKNEFTSKSDIVIINNYKDQLKKLKGEVNELAMLIDNVSIKDKYSHNEYKKNVSRAIAGTAIAATGATSYIFYQDYVDIDSHEASNNFKVFETVRTSVITLALTAIFSNTLINDYGPFNQRHSLVEQLTDFSKLVIQKIDLANNNVEAISPSLFYEA